MTRGRRLKDGARGATTRTPRALHVLRASPYLTVQDEGRPGHRHAGIPVSGAMDVWALRVANVLAGNAPGAAALEHALGAATLRFTADTPFALAGADCDAELRDEPASAHRTLFARAGDTLTLGPPRAGRFAYLAVAGAFAVPPVLGSAATYLPAALGGMHGRRLRDDDVVEIGPAPIGPRALDCPPLLLRELGVRPSPDDALDDALDVAPIRVVRGPQADVLDAAAWREFLDAEWTVRAIADRTGYRLAGPPIRVSTSVAARPSEPGCVGAVQLPPDGEPIVLMADAPTVGGYPKPAIVCTADIGRLAQHAPGTLVRFREVPLDQAQRAYRRRCVAIHTLERLRGSEESRP